MSKKWFYIFPILCCVVIISQWLVDASKLEIIIVCSVIFAVCFVILFIKLKRSKDLDDLLNEINFEQNLSYFMQSLFGTSQLRNSVEASRQIVDNFTKNKTLDYLVKYFDMVINDETVGILNDFAEMMEKCETQIRGKKRITKYFNENYLPIFSFNYTSPAGKSQSSSTFELNFENLRNLAQMVEKKQNKNQGTVVERGKMTKQLREAILKRDNYTCQKCGNSQFVEPNLLLEVDHIIPISKGGKTEPGNLQTLCWKCNRSKSDNV